MKLERFKYTFIGMKQCKSGKYIHIGYHLKISNSLKNEKIVLEGNLQRVKFKLARLEKENKIYSDIINKIGTSLQSLPRKEKDKTVLLMYKEYYGSIIKANIYIDAKCITTIDVERESL